MSTRFIGVMSLAAALVSIGCDSKPTQQPPLASPQPAAPAAAPSGAAPAPAMPARGPASAPVASGPLDAHVSLMGVTITLPDGWKRNPPANQMRLAEAEVPGPGGDAAKACLVVFSTAGGAVEDNIARWAGQVRDAAGQPAASKPESKVVNGVKVTTVLMTGSFAGMGDAAPRPNWALRGAIVETADGLLFIKMTGPAEQINATGAAFAAMVDGIKKP